MRVATVVALGAALLVGAECGWAAPQGDLLNAANREAQRLGYDLSQMHVAYDEGNAQWEEYHTAHAGSGQAQEVATSLTGHVYQAVYYQPEAEELGGDLWVFIDADTGEVLATIQGE